MSREIRGAAELYAHALAIEREAAERYAEFEAHFRERGEEVLAGLCGNLARLESGHLAQLVEASRNLEIPPIDAAGYRWLEAASPESGTREAFYRLAAPRQLLEVALQNECAAFAFFGWVGRNSPDARTRALAREMAGEELQHMTWVRDALDYQPSSRMDRERLIARGVGPGSLVGDGEG